MHSNAPGSLASTAPPAPASSDHGGCSGGEERRLTFMVGFWSDNVVEVGERRWLGPCGPLPTREELEEGGVEATWLEELRGGMRRLNNGGVAVQKTEKGREVPPRLEVREVRPAWEEVRPAEEGQGERKGVLEVPDNVDQRFFVR